MHEEHKGIKKDYENENHKNKKLESEHDKVKSKVENVERLKDENRGLFKKQLNHSLKEIKDQYHEFLCDQIKYEVLLEKLKDEVLNLEQKVVCMKTMTF